MARRGYSLCMVWVMAKKGYSLSMAWAITRRGYFLCVVWPEGLVFYVWFNRWLEEVACLVNSQNNRFKKVKITKVNI